MDSADAMKYGWGDAKIVGTISVMNIKEIILIVDININNHLDWSILPVDLKKRICSSFNNGLLLFYKSCSL